MKSNLRIFLLALAAVLGIATAGAKDLPGQKVGVSFAELAYDFGNVSEDGEPVVHEYTYSNVGDSPVTVLWAKASCGCTMPKYERKPLRPGEKATIRVKFIPKGQKGEVDKDVSIQFRNGKGKKEKVTLRLKGTVTPVAKK